MPLPGTPAEPSDAAKELESLMTPGEGSGAPATPPEKKPEEKPAPAAAAPEKKETPADEDPELDFGDGLGKIKRSAARDLLTKGQDYSKKTEELNQRAQMVKHLEELSETLAKSPKKLEGVLKILEAKEDADAAQAAADKGTGTQKEADAAAAAAKNALNAALEKLDPEDPAAAVLKHLVGEIGSLSSVVKGFETRESMLRKQEEENAKAAAEKQQTEAYQAQVQDAGKALTETLESMQKELKFEHESEGKLWRKMALSIIKDSASRIEKKEDWIAAIKDAGKRAADELQGVIQMRLSGYIKSKSSPTIPAGGAKSGEPAPITPTMDNIQDVLEAELSKALREKTT